MPRIPLARGAPVLICGNSQSRPHPDGEEHTEGDAFVQIPMLDGNGHQQSPQEQDVGVIEVLDADLDGQGQLRGRKTLGSSTVPLGLQSAVTDFSTEVGPWALGIKWKESLDYLLFNINQVPLFLPNSFFLPSGTTRR